MQGNFEVLNPLFEKLGIIIMESNKWRINFMDDSHIKSISDILKEYPIIFAYLFGSQEKDKSTKLSDIDIGIFIEKKSIKVIEI